MTMPLRTRSTMLCEHFTLGEFLPAGFDAQKIPPIHFENLKKLAQRLQILRETVFEHRAVRISPNGGGYRSISLNRQVGGASQSYHLTGMAADIQVAGLTPRQTAERLSQWAGGLGLYPAHVHVDIGPHRRWMGHY
ncbi:MAG: D-Ala-D-Ala carboxypeptidase family metallohydrolase [Vampirovibrionales bacterium]|nr:D-Ala-D-Ala carboxypeptidase family metallohydrolase [Vampirovibrionales bacterium]